MSGKYSLEPDQLYGMRSDTRAKRVRERDEMKHGNVARFRSSEAHEQLDLNYNTPEREVVESTDTTQTVASKVFRGDWIFAPYSPDTAPKRREWP